MIFPFHSRAPFLRAVGCRQKPVQADEDILFHIVLRKVGLREPHEALTRNDFQLFKESVE